MRKITVNTLPRDLIYARFEDMKKRQLNFGITSNDFKNYWKKSGRKSHGSDLAQGKRKVARPFSANKAMHVTMRSKKATGVNSLRSFKNYGQIVECIEANAKKTNVTVHEFSVNGNHLHLLISTKRKLALQKFLRIVAGHVARIVLGGRRGNPSGTFWDALSYSRIVEFGRDFKSTCLYIFQNWLEAAGIIPYEARGKTSGRHLKIFLQELGIEECFLASR